MNDADFPVAEVLRGIDAAAARRPRPDQGQHGGQARHQRRTRSCRWRATSAARRTSLRFIEYMDVGATNGWRMDEVLPSAEVVARDRASCRSCRSSRIAPGETAERWRYAETARRRDRRDLERHAGVLPRLQPRAPVDRGQALPLPVREPRPRPARAACAAARATPRSPRRSASSGSGRDDRYSELRSAAQATTPARRAARRDALHRRVSGDRRTNPAARRGRPRRLQARCATTCSRLHPGAFTSDADSEARAKEPTDYLHRLGLERRDARPLRARRLARQARCSARSAASAKRA